MVCLDLPYKILVTLDDKKEDKSVLNKILVELNTLNASAHPVAYAFTIVSALDILSQLNSGKLKKIGAVKRFKRFTEQYLGLRPSEQEILYQFRNATVHTFGQYAFNEKTKTEYRFVYHEEGVWVQKLSRTVYSINLIQLKSKLDRAVQTFETNLKNDPELKKRHDLVYRKIGTAIAP